MTGAPPPPLPRFWCPADDAYALDESGYLADPDTAPRAGGRLGATPTKDLTPHRALVLLGEPGMGKTTVMRAHRPLLDDARSGAAVVAAELDTFASEERLIREIFESPPVLAWQAGDSELCLFLDGVDEVSARLPTFPALAADYLRRWPSERLLLRLSCRTADWPVRLQDALHGSYGRDAAVVELLPLRRDDVGSLVRDLVDSDAFLAEVERRGAAPLAARPLTARMLAKEFARTGQLPDRAADIYRTALLALCDDPDRSGHMPAGSPSDRLAAARRIAAVTIFGTRPTVWTGRLADREPQDATVDDCCGDTEATNGSSVVVAEPLVRAALRTALFAGRGEGRLGWAHATFADYLSAQWLIANQLSRPQLRSLLLAQDGRLYPQVRSTAAWAVASDPAGTGWLVRCDPEAFVGEVDIPDAALRAEVVEGLMELAATGVWRRDWRTSYRNLHYPALADRVRRALASESEDVRRLALDLASHCALQAVREDLVSIALDRAHHPGHERNSAALAVLHMNEGAPGADLLPLVQDPAMRGDDPDDELLGAALLATWPQALSTADALEHVRTPQRRNLYGNYALFIGRLAQALTAAELPQALDWLQRVSADADEHHLAPLVNATLRLSFDRLDDPGTLKAVSRYARSRGKAYLPLLADDVSADADQGIPKAARRRLALSMLEDPDDDVLFAVAAPGSGPGLLDDDDFLWLVSEYADADMKTRTALGRVAGWLFRIDDRDQVDAVLGLPADHPLRRDVTGKWSEPILLDSPEAVAGREQWRSIRQRRQRRRSPADAPPVDDWIAEHLDAVEAGDTAGFWQAARLITVPPGGGRYREEHQPDLTAHPRWASLPASAHQRLLEAAKRYAREGECNAERWLGEDVRYFPAEAGYQAMLLILRLDPDELPRLAPETWQRWAPIIVSWTCTVNGASWQDKRALLEHALPHAGAELRDALAAVVRAAVRNENHLFARDETALLWDESVAADLEATVESGLPDPPRSVLLDLLAEHAMDRARPLLHRWLDTEAIDAEPERASTAVRVLLARDAPSSWPLIRQRLDERPDFAAAALLASADTAVRQVPDLDEQSLAQLYRWLAQRFPPATDPQFEDAHWVGPRESVGRWRDTVLQDLRDAGTEAAVRALRWLADDAPDQNRLRHVVAEAEDRARTARWSPIPPDQLRRLARQHQTRLVGSSADLLDLVVEALEAVQQRLQGQTPDAHLLWDTAARRPKRENEISGYLRNQLDDRLGGRSVAVNREVEVRSTSPTGIGERVDLLISAAATQRPGNDWPPQVSVVAEVKGAWNPGVIDAVRSQLVDRYMADVGTRHGVYVVAWFDPGWWNPADSARARAARWPSRSELQQQLDAAADVVRSEGAHVRCVVLDCSYNRPGR